MTARSSPPTAIGGTWLADTLQRLSGKVGQRRLVTLHHLACSGGTIISKAIAAMNSTLVLSEIHPDRVIQPEFHALSQIRKGYGHLLAPEHEKAIRGHFRNEIGIAHEIATSIARTLIVRDHAHVDFAWNNRDHSLLIAQLQNHFEITPIITLRDPREVWLSLKREGWFDGTVDDLCAAHCRLLAAIPDAPVFSYEDFTSDPDATLLAISECGDFEYNADYMQRIDQVTHLTGDSGRKGTMIEPRPAKSLPQDDAAAFNDAPEWARFNQLIGERGLASYG